MIKKCKKVVLLSFFLFTLLIFRSNVNAANVIKSVGANIEFSIEGQKGKGTYYELYTTLPAASNKEYRGGYFVSSDGNCKNGCVCYNYTTYYKPSSESSPFNGINEISYYVNGEKKTTKYGSTKLYDYGNGQFLCSNNIGYLNSLYTIYNSVVTGSKKNKGYYLCSVIKGNNMLISDIYTTAEEAQNTCNNNSEFSGGRVTKVAYKEFQTSVMKTTYDSVVYYCSWNDEDGSIMGFKTTISTEKNKITYENMPGADKKIENLNVAMSYNTNQIRQLLNGSNNIPKSNLYKDKRDLGCTYEEKTDAELPTNYVMSISETTSASGASGFPLLNMEEYKKALSDIKKIKTITVSPGYMCNYASVIGSSDESESYYVQDLNLNAEPHYAKTTCSFNIFTKKESDKTPTTTNDPKEKMSCESIFDGSDFGKILSFIFKLLRLAALALLLILSVIDFVRPIVSGNVEELQTSGIKFIKRLIIFVLVLYVPLIVDILLSLIGISCDLPLF